MNNKIKEMALIVKELTMYELAAEYGVEVERC